MPANFHTVPPAIWDRTQRQLSGPAKVVRYYVQTCRLRLSEGLFELPFGHLVYDTGLSEKHVREGLEELERAGLVSYDEDAEVILDRTALVYMPLKNGRTVDKETGEVTVKPDNRLTGAVRKFGQVPTSPLRVEFYRLAREHSPDLADALALAHPGLWSADSSGYDDVPFDPPPEAPPKPLASPSEGASRAEASRYEQSRGDGVPCATCGESALVSLGEVQVDLAGLPHCSFCPGTEVPA
jgi:DNA-binding transcriptional ArsR family regulator